MSPILFIVLLGVVWCVQPQHKASMDSGDGEVPGGGEADREWGEAIHRWLIRQTQVGRGRLRHAAQLQTHQIQGSHQRPTHAEIQWHTRRLHERGKHGIVLHNPYQIFVSKCWCSSTVETLLMVAQSFYFTQQVVKFWTLNTAENYNFVSFCTLKT